MTVLLQKDLKLLIRNHSNNHAGSSRKIED